MISGLLILFQPGLSWRFVLDTLFTIFIINTLVAFVLKGYWILFEVYMPADYDDPDDLLRMSMTSFLVFFGVVIIPIIGQYELLRLNKNMQQKSTVCKVLLQEIFLVIFSPLPMLFWRGAYLLHQSFVTPDYHELYAWCSHVIGFLGVTAMLASTSMLPVGCVSDRDAFESVYGVFDYRYVRAFISKRRRHKHYRDAGKEPENVRMI